MRLVQDYNIPFELTNYAQVIIIILTDAINFSLVVATGSFIEVQWDREGS